MPHRGAVSRRHLQLFLPRLSCRQICESPIVRVANRRRNLHQISEPLHSLESRWGKIWFKFFENSRCVPWCFMGLWYFWVFPDDRFILKDMPRAEVQIFLDSSANYFTYMQKCCSTMQPTLLGKIVGIYQIYYKNACNVEHRSYLLVMENLFYNRNVSQKFDLKGSMRNRLVVPDNEEGEVVWLDENLLKSAL